MNVVESARPMSEDTPQIAVLAALPPPVNGLHQATGLVVEYLRRRSAVLVHDWSAGGKLKGLSWRIVKGIRSIFSLFKLVQWRCQGCRILYTVANGNGGLYYNLLTIAAARLLGFRCVLHHHTYIYLASFDWRMAVINWLLGVSDTHVVLAPEMGACFRKVYGSRSGFVVLPNYYVLSTFSSRSFPQRDSSSTVFRLGHISNLTFAKGLRRVADTFERLVASFDVNLMLAGPLMGHHERVFVDELLSRYPGRIKYLGPVYGEEKEQFYAGIDVLLFPSEMDEAQPLVILEAFQFGKPVIAYAKGCIPSMIAEDGGLVIPFDKEFVADASCLLSEWISKPDEYERVSRMVERKVEKLRGECDEQLEEFYQILCGSPAVVASSFSVGDRGAR